MRSEDHEMTLGDGVDDELMKLIEEFSNRVNPKLKKKLLTMAKNEIFWYFIEF